MKVSNPLTIISIFSGLAEILATTALINLPQEMQEIFVYFVMAFPTLIVVLFFLVLVFKNKALYAPSDYANQEHYMEIHDLKSAIKQNMYYELEATPKDRTPEERAQLRELVDKMLESSFKSTRREQILKFLAEKSGTTREICDETGIHPSYGSLILKNLEDEGFVEKIKEGRAFKWSLNG